MKQVKQGFFFARPAPSILQLSWFFLAEHWKDALRTFRHADSLELRASMECSDPYGRICWGGVPQVVKRAEPCGQWLFGGGLYHIRPVRKSDVEKHATHTGRIYFFGVQHSDWGADSEPENLQGQENELVSWVTWPGMAVMLLGGISEKGAAAFSKYAITGCFLGVLTLSGAQICANPYLGLPITQGGGNILHIKQRL